MFQHPAEMVGVTGSRGHQYPQNWYQDAVVIRAGSQFCLPAGQPLELAALSSGSASTFSRHFLPHSQAAQLGNNAHIVLFLSVTESVSKCPGSFQGCSGSHFAFITCYSAVSMQVSLESTGGGFFTHLCLLGALPGNSVFPHSRCLKHSFTFL